MPVRRSSQRCDIRLDDLEDEDQVAFTPPPPYSGRHTTDEQITNTKKLKKQWTSAALAVTGDDKKKMQEVLKVWEGEGTTFKEFIDNTTVHGVKHIFEESPYRVRRILWLICFLGALIFFVVQVVIRTKEYYRYKTNVDVQVKYVPSMTFPAVTICNQNTFRMTEVVDMDMYEFVDYVFETDMRDINFEGYEEYNEVNSSEFLQQAAHQLEDMIDSCHYNTLKCDVSDFKMTFTDMGICYTFNHDPNNVKMITEAGAGYGLRLVLNVEQYQAMRGPQNDAGLKVLLHQQDEFPAVKNLGFSVAPGTHTLVGVYVKEVNGIEPPWGICSLSAQPISNCKRECKADMVASMCQCVDVHMTYEGAAGGNSHTLAEVCNLPNLWGCVRNVTDHLQTNGDSCDCTIPCERTTYEPRLSYAQLSRINIDRLVLKEATKSAKVKTNFEASLETLQRVDSNIASADESTMTALQDDISDLEAILEALNMTLGEGSDLSDILSEMSEALDSDAEMVDDFDDDMEDEIENLDKDRIKLIEFMLQNMYMMLGSPDTAQVALDLSLDCVHLMTLSLPYPDDTVAEEVIDAYTSGMDHQDWKPNYVPSANETDSGMTLTPDACDSHLTDMILGVQEFYHIMVAAHDYSQSFLQSYKTVVDNIYTGTNQNASTINEHATCIAFIEDEYVPSFDFDVIALVGAFDDVRRSSNKEQLRTAFTTLFDESMNSQVLNYTVWYDELKNKCWWLDDWMESEDKFEDDLEDGVEHLERASYSAKMALGEVTKLIEELDILQELVSDNIAYYTNLTSLYIEGKLTKLSVAESFSAMEASKVFEDLITENANFKSYLDEYDEYARHIISCSHKGFDYLTKMRLPVIKYATLGEMDFLTLLKAMNETRMAPLIHGILGDTTESFKAIEDIFVETYLEKGNTYQMEMTGKVSRISGIVTTLRTKMAVYEASAVIDQDFLLNNFLQVDIFYRELSYDLITQHKAFELLSLFSEVGGFLGLLLGASILSLIELVDYLVMLGTRKWKEKHQVQARAVKKF